jgi:nitronate monooxygenase
MKERRITWFATMTTVAEALAAQEAGADVIVAQGMEAGGHRGAFRAEDAEANMVGLFSLIPAVVDAVERPVVATGGIADPRGVAAALMLGASAVQVGTAFLRAPEVGLPSAWADAIGRANPEDTVTTRAYSGRLARTIRNAYTSAAASPDAPKPAPYPIQRSLTRPMRTAAEQDNRIDTLNALAGQSAKLAQAKSAKDIVHELWEGATDLLS